MFFSRKPKQQVKVTELNLAYRKLEVIPLDIGEKYASLTHLDLSNNAISDPSVLIDLDLLETLILDHNRLTSASRIPPLPKLTFLSVNHNKIGNLTAFVDRLAFASPRLSYFSMLGNPACPNFLNGGSKAQYEDYRRYVICRLKFLKNLDGQQVLDEERQAAEALYGSVSGNLLNVDPALKSVILKTGASSSPSSSSSSSSAPSPASSSSASPVSSSTSPPSSASSSSSSTSSSTSSTSTPSSSLSSTSATPEKAAVPTTTTRRKGAAQQRARSDGKDTPTTTTTRTKRAPQKRNDDLLPSVDLKSDGANRAAPPPPPPAFSSPSPSKPSPRAKAAPKLTTTSRTAKNFIDLPSPLVSTTEEDGGPPPPPPVSVHAFAVGDASISDEESWTESVEGDEEEEEEDHDESHLSDVAGRLPNVQYRSNHNDDDEDEEESWTESDDGDDGGLPPVVQSQLPEPQAFLPSVAVSASAEEAPPSAPLAKFFQPRPQNDESSRSESSDWSD